jgi:hypothetical protein
MIEVVLIGHPFLLYGGSGTIERFQEEATGSISFFVRGVVFFELIGSYKMAPRLIHNRPGPGGCENAWDRSATSQQRNGPEKGHCGEVAHWSQSSPGPSVCLWRSESLASCFSDLHGKESLTKTNGQPAGGQLPGNLVDFSTFW